MGLTKNFEMFDFIKERKLKFFVFGILCVFAIVAWSVFVWQDDITNFLSDLSLYFRDKVKVLDDIPLVIYSLAIFILPLFFLPVTPIYFLASVRTDEYSYIIILIFCLIGVTANIVVSYFIARKFGVFLRSVISKRGLKIPEISSSEHYEFIFLMRMIPGNPLTVQNYGLGIANVSFFKYMVVSLPIQYIQISAYIYFGEGIFEGCISKIILASSLLVIIAIIARILDKRYGDKLRNN